MIRLSKRLANLERAETPTFPYRSQLEYEMFCRVQQLLGLPLRDDAPPSIQAAAWERLKLLQKRLRATEDTTEQEALCVAFRSWVESVNRQYGGDQCAE